MKLTRLVSYAVAAVAMTASSRHNADAHSFVMCTDIRSDGSCAGYPRNYAIHDVIQDGYTYRPGTSNIACDPQHQNRTSPVASSYSSKYPMAVASAGSSLTLQWPARNHAPASLPGRSLEIYWIPQANLDVDPDQAQLNANTLTTLPFGDLPNGDSVCEPGTPNDRLCTGSFKIPEGTSPGVYTFQWWWEFNPGEFYASCFEVNVGNVDSNSAGGGGSATTPTGTAGPTTGTSAPTSDTTSSPTTTTAEPTTAAVGDDEGESDSDKEGQEEPTSTSEVTPTAASRRPCGRRHCGEVGAQCGGEGFTGVRCCKGSAVCQKQSASYFQCVKRSLLRV